MLVDYIPINSENESIEPKQTKTFESNWHGFGDQFVDQATEIPTIKFRNLNDVFQNTKEYQFSFFEKLIAEQQNFPVNVNILLNTLDTKTGNNSVQEPFSYQMNIPYLIIKKTLNTGLIVNF